MIWLAGCGCGCLLVAAVVAIVGIAFLGWLGGNSKFVNSRDGLAGEPLNSYVDFSFEYPNTWTFEKTEPGGSNYAKVTHNNAAGSTLENLAISYYHDNTPAGNNTLASQLLNDQLLPQLKTGFPNLTKLGEGPAKFGTLDAYEMRLESAFNDAESGIKTIWMRVILVKNPKSERGISVIMMGTNLSSQVKGIDSLGTGGDLKSIADSFQFR
ncbi:MAG TPA: hypothetical protein VKX17_26470 [Planctomycetota bacterium]|nr:hypothetical protein [Planctomycetota bacterium]